MPEEADYIKRIKHGDKAAFDFIVDENINKVRLLALSLTRNPHEADDLAQEVFLKAFKSINAFRNDCKISTWLYRITINTYLNLKKKKDRFNEKNHQNENEAGKYFSSHHSSSRRHEDINGKIETALRLLTPKEKAVFVLRHYEEIKISEIALMLAISKNSVKTLLRRAVFKLKDLNTTENDSDTKRGSK